MGANNNGLGQSCTVAWLLRALLVLLLLALLSTLGFSGSSCRIEAQPANQREGNLVSNPSFEDPSPASWYNAGSSVGSLLHFWSGDTAHSGDHSIGIISFESSVQGQWWSDPFTVYAGWPYGFSGWIKADSLSNGVYLTLAFYSSQSKADLIEEFSSPQITGSSEWTKATSNAVAPSNAHYGRILCELEGQGTAWFDDITAELQASHVYCPLVLKDFSAFCNGGFETGSFACWTQGGRLERSILRAPVYEGRYAAELGSGRYACRNGVPVGSAWLSQTFTVPSCSDPSHPKPTLFFKYIIFSQDVLRGDKWDSFDVYIDSMLILRDGNDEWEEARCDTVWKSGWRSHSEDLSAYIGQTVEVTFRNMSRVDGWYNTWTYVDSVQVTCEP